MLKLLLLLSLMVCPGFRQGTGKEYWERPDPAGTRTDLASGSDTLRVMSWNVENFFSPGEFEGHVWSKGRFYTKCGDVAKTILLAGDAFGGVPDLVGLCEVGDADVMKALIYSTPLRKLDYAFVHYDSPDRRGIDCALLYRRSRFRVVSSMPCHLYDSTGAVMSTRDILLAVLEPIPVCKTGDSAHRWGRIAVLVNHHPSKVGAGSEERRRIAMARLRFLSDSLKAEGIPRIIAIGDFNAPVEPAEGITPAASVFPGTIKFQGLWEKIDGCPVLEGFSATEYIFAPPHLLERDSYGGGKTPPHLLRPPLQSRHQRPSPDYSGNKIEIFPTFE